MAIVSSSAARMTIVESLDQSVDKSMRFATRQLNYELCSRSDIYIDKGY